MFFLKLLYAKSERPRKDDFQGLQLSEVRDGRISELELVYGFSRLFPDMPGAWHTPVAPAPGRQRQKDVSWRLAWAAEYNPAIE